MKRQALSVCATLLAAVGFAMPMMPQKIPGDRLIKNLEAKLAKEPDNASIYYLIGRAHYASFASTYEGNYLKPGEIEYFPPYNGSLAGFPAYFGYKHPWNGSFEPKPTADNIRHVEGAVENLDKSIQLEPKNSALAHLTLACVFESAAPIASHVHLDASHANQKTIDQFKKTAAEEYLRAYDQSVAMDQKEKTIPLFGLQTLISYEAARSYLRLQPNGSRHGELHDALAKFNKLPSSGIVTPLIFSLTTDEPLSNLLDPSKVVRFDLDGTGLPQRYGWVKPTTAFLVWDPEGAGKIETGRRLFGTATWWMLWSSAYQALDSLDDDHDGWLTGQELKGLAIWIDRNQNGRSDPGEVISLDQAGIQAFATNYTQTVGRSLANPQGLRMKDGRMLPTYDWVTSQVKG